MDQGDNLPTNEEIARLHAFLREQVRLFCEKYGYGCTIDLAARIWAERPDSVNHNVDRTRSDVVFWLRELADRLETKR